MSMQLLCDLIDQGYRFSGINYSCGCSGTKVIKDKQVVDEYYTLCVNAECTNVVAIKERCANPDNNSRISDK